MSRPLSRLTLALDNNDHLNNHIPPIGRGVFFFQYLWGSEMSLISLDGQRVHFLGIGGIGVSALARLLLAQGVQVSGSDVRPSTLTEALEEEGAEVMIGQRAENLERADIVVYSTAIPATNPELVAARASGKPVLHRSELLGILVAAHQTVGITGTNGKGTVSSMLTWILEVAGERPSFYIGANCTNFMTNARITGGPRFVAELDESDGSLLNTKPLFGVLNNLEMDHLNYYKDFDHVIQVLTTFFSQLPEDGVAFFNGDDKGAMLVKDKVSQRAVVFGQARDVDYQAYEIHLGPASSEFKLKYPDDQVVEFKLNVPGSYNVENATAALAVAGELGIDHEACIEALATYEGMKNRYTVIKAGDCTLVKDYISHPTGIRKVLETARLQAAGRVRAVFKPYRYTMINYHAQNYCNAFQGADEVILTEMWEANEEPIPGVTTPWLGDEMRRHGLSVEYVAQMDQILPYLIESTKPGDTILFFGGDDLFALADQMAASKLLEA
jgi:UDP-N-acetylmuramate--alanine ligase